MGARTARQAGGQGAECADTPPSSPTGRQVTVLCAGLPTILAEGLLLLLQARVVKDGTWKPAIWEETDDAGRQGWEGRREFDGAESWGRTCPAAIRQERGSGIETGGACCCWG